MGYVPLGDTPDTQAVLLSEQRRLSKAIIDAVIREAALNTGIQIGLIFVPVIGQAIAGLLSLMNMILGQVYERQIQRIIADTMAAIQTRASAAQAKIEAAGNQVCIEEYPTAIQLAMSNQTFNGLGSIWTSITGAVKAVPQQIKQVISDPKSQTKFLTSLNPIGLTRLAVKDVQKAAISTAKAIESTGAVNKGTLSQPLYSLQNKTDDVMYSAAKLSSPFTVVQESVGLTFKYGSMIVAAAMEATGNQTGADAVRKIGNQVHGASQEMMTALTPTGGYNLFSGREGYLAARDACEHMRMQAFAAIDAQAQDAIAKLQSPEGRQNTRVALAKALRNDPSFIAKAQELRDLEAQQMQPLQQREDLLSQAAGPPSSGAGTLLGVAAAGTAAFLIAR